MYGYLIRCIMCSHDTDKHYGTWCEAQGLPRATRLPGAVRYNLPVPHVPGRFDVVAVTALVTVPQQETHTRQHVRLPQLDENGAGAELVARVAAVPVVVLDVTVQQGIP